MSSEAQVRKIRRLLDKASSTDSAHEASALIDKAMALMAKWRIDEAALEAARPSDERRGEVAVRTIHMGSGQYVLARVAILTAVAKAFGCAIVTERHWGERLCDVFGFPADIETVEVIYTALLAQATSDLMAEPIPKGVSSVTFRRAFLFGFAQRVAGRLNALHRAAVSETTSPTSTALVLADRSEEVSGEVHRLYGKLPGLYLSPGANRDGANAGHRSGERADLSVSPRIDKPREAIGR